MPDKLTANVVGCGIGGRLSIGGLKAAKSYELVAVADLRPEACREIQDEYPNIRTFTDYRTMFRECPADVVCVSTYAPTHEPIAMAAMDTTSLKGILVEKPLGDTAASGRRILEAIKSRALPMVVPHGMLASSCGADVLSSVRDGAIGKLGLVELQCSKQDIINAGIHLLNFFVNLTNLAEMDYVMATCEATTRTYRDGMQVETTAVTYGQTASGIRVVLNSGDDVMITRPGSGHLIRIVGSQGLIEFRKADKSYTIVNAEHPGGEVITPEPWELGGHGKYLYGLADMIGKGHADYRIPDSSLKALELVEAAYLSSRHQCKVTFPLADFAVPDRVDWDPGMPYGGTGGGRDGKEL